MSAKETQITKTMQSIDGIRSLEAPSAMTQNIMERVSNMKVIALRPQFTWAVAASLALLIGVNSLTLLQYNKSANNDKLARQAISAEYFSYTVPF